MTRAVGIGTGPLREGGRVDFARLREDRRRRLWASMDEENVDVLLLGRPANINFATGARLLWTAGQRPFSIGCVAVRRTGRIHLLSTWDEGIPEEIRLDELFGLSWNPLIAAQRLSAIEGIHAAAAVASDGWSPAAQTTIDAVFPGATLQDAGPLLERIRGPKSPDEVTCIRTAAALAEAVLGTILAALRPGVTSRELVGTYLEAAAGLGSSCPPTEAVIWITGPDAGPHGPRRWPWRLPSERRLQAGELVVINPATFYGGYEGVLGRTFVVGGEVGAPTLAGWDHCRQALNATIASCQPGSTGADLVAAWTAANGGQAPDVLARGVGLGAEPPVIGRAVGEAAVLDEGLVLAVGGALYLPDGESVPGGGVFEQDMVLVGASGPSVLTRYATGPEGRGHSPV